MDVFIIFQLSANDFRVRTKGKETATLQETQVDLTFQPY